MQTASRILLGGAPEGFDARLLARELEKGAPVLHIARDDKRAEAMAAAKACGWSHVYWAPAGFLGDELPSDRFPNDKLLKQALADIRGGDILMAHLGIWSRKDPYAPMLDPLIGGLKEKGYCFATLRPRA
jgi:peptidoglycan/xylan/chitin deacetylase (PgdA/CDA1 family)